MVKEALVGKGALLIGASVVFCGLTLYAAGQVLNYLFRDVDPKRIDQAPEEDPESIEVEEPAGSEVEEPVADSV